MEKDLVHDNIKCDRWCALWAHFLLPGATSMEVNVIWQNVSEKNTDFSRMKTDSKHSDGEVRICRR
ncbi:hypothetical protein FACS1894208_03280 [Clostridia bacterium]|nr:hypothetical protein FACS1894208_03280 [Clostridia bacterium]